MHSKPFLTALKEIPTEGGNVLHGMKASGPGFAGFGEAYVSIVNAGAVKGWKRHREMTLNLFVPTGSVQFRLFDSDEGFYTDYVLGPKINYARLTVPPGLWMAFGGVDHGPSTVINIANIEHDPGESDRAALDAFDWIWADL